MIQAYGSQQEVRVLHLESCRREIVRNCVAVRGKEMKNESGTKEIERETKTERREAKGKEK